jgi:YVTN family beta-propeller protein
MKVQRVLMLSTFLVALASASNAQTPKTALLALSKRDHTLAIIDPADLKVVATVPVGDDPHEVTASADGRTAYVSNYGFGSLHTLAVIWSARLEMCQWRRETLDKESIWDEERSTSLSRW